jgi:hypothetical protein
MSKKPGRTDPLATLLHLEEFARKAASATELAFVMVNDTRALLPYGTAALWVAGRGVVAVSGGAAIDPHAPFILWLDRTVKALAGGDERPRRIVAADIGQWQDWLPDHAVRVNLRAPDGSPVGALLLARDTVFENAELALLDHVAAIYAFAWQARHRPSPWTTWRARLTALPRWKLKVAAAVFLVLLFPVHLSVLTPAEVVARAPAVLRAPLDGVVEKVHVRPNQTVAEGELLVELDTTTLSGRKAVAEGAVATAEAELDQATQQAFFDPKAKGQLAVIRSRIDERRSELAQIDDMLTRSRMQAPRAGVAVLDDPSEWNGRPVSVGEKILSIAEPAAVEVEAWLAPADVIALEAEAPVTLFLNTDPLAPVSTHLLYVAYEAIQPPGGPLAHRVRAALAPDQAPPRLGLKGTARLDGHQVPLIYWLLRRPLATIRQVVGL